MSQFNAPVRRSGGEIDVYTGLLSAAFLVLLAGIILMAVRNIEHTSTPSQSGGPIKLVQ